MISVICPEGKLSHVTANEIRTISDLTSALYDIEAIEHRKVRFFFNQKLLKPEDEIPVRAITNSIPIALIPDDSEYTAYLQKEPTQLSSERFSDFFVPVDTPEISLIASPGFPSHFTSTNPDDVLPIKFYDSSTTDSEIESESDLSDSQEYSDYAYRNSTLLDHLNVLYDDGAQTIDDDN